VCAGGGGSGVGKGEKVHADNHAKAK